MAGDTGGRAYGQAVAVDAQAHRAAAGAGKQPVGKHVPVRQQKLPLDHARSRGISCSIQASTCWLSASGRSPAVLMGAPMLTVMTPGFLRKPFLPQNSPALCATGNAA